MIAITTVQSHFLLLQIQNCQIEIFDRQQIIFFSIKRKHQTVKGKKDWSRWNMLASTREKRTYTSNNQHMMVKHVIPTTEITKTRTNILQSQERHMQRFVMIYFMSKCTSMAMFTRSMHANGLYPVPWSWWWLPSTPVTLKNSRQNGNYEVQLSGGITGLTRTWNLMICRDFNS